MNFIHVHSRRNWTDDLFTSSTKLCNTASAYRAVEPMHTVGCHLMILQRKVVRMHTLLTHVPSPLAAFLQSSHFRACLPRFQEPFALPATEEEYRYNVNPSALMDAQERRGRRGFSPMHPEHHLCLHPIPSNVGEPLPWLRPERLHSCI